MSSFFVDAAMCGVFAVSNGRHKGVAGRSVAGVARLGNGTSIPRTWRLQKRNYVSDAHDKPLMH